MISLIVEVAGPGMSAPARHAFIRSPVRVGRNALSDVPLLQPSVSMVHGELRFGGAAVRYVDLGSTNGSWIGAARAPAGAEVVVEPGAPLRIGPFTLLARLEARDGGAADASASSAARPAAPSRAVEVLESFARSFVAVRKALGEYGREVGVQAVRGDAPLRAADAQELLAYLLDPATEDAGRRVEAAFVELLVHHVAFVAGVGEGGRALLEALDPQAIDAAAGRRGWARHRRRWRAFEARFRELAATDLRAVLFGPAFARAYEEITGAGEHADPPVHPET